MVNDSGKPPRSNDRPEAAGTGSGTCERDLDVKQLWVDRAWMCGLCGLVYALLFREELIQLLDSWTSSAAESHGFLIPAFSLYFLWQQRKALSTVRGKPCYLGLALMLATVLAYVWFIFIQMYYPRQIMMLAMLGAMVLLVGGWRIVKLTWLPIAFLIFALPLPTRLYYAVSMPLREWSSIVAAVILNSLPDVSAEAYGVIITGTHLNENFNLNVAEACSGMRLLMAFLALGVAMAYLEKRPAVHRVVLLCSTIPIAIFCNMLRVLITGFIHIYAGAEYATGLLHTLLGLVTLGVAFALYGLLAWLMNRLVVEEEEGEDILVVGGGVQERKGSS